MIKKGDRIRISCKGHIAQGVAISAVNYGSTDRPNWYIELTDEMTGRYAYWKQELDGGAIELLETKT